MKPITRRETLLNQIADNTSGNAGSIDMEPITREEVYLKQIADNTASGGGGGGSDLPAVTSDDNGDVLTVVNGAWDKAAPSGGSDLPGTPAQDGTYTLTNTVSSGAGTLSWGAGDNATLVIVHDDEGQLDKTWQEIFDAVSEGNIVFVSANSETFASFLPVLAVMDDAGVYRVFVLMADISTSEMIAALYIANTANDYPILD